MAGWLRALTESGRLPLFCFFVAMIVGFGFIRLSVRMIRANVRWWPGNVTPGDLHIHHVVFGVVFMLVGGVAGLAIPDGEAGWSAAVAALFGLGSALVLDEFALILHLRDVYWHEHGRLSVDAVFVAIACTGLLVIGVRPFWVDDFVAAFAQPGPGGPLLWGSLAVVFDLGMAVLTLLKGKIWTGLLGLFLPLLLIIGAVRLARPDSPWARWRYGDHARRGPRKLARAHWRERRLRAPVARAKVRLQELIAGAPD